MQFRSLGGSGLKVSSLCMGTMTFGNQADKKTSWAMLDRAWEAGINFIDTADGYPLGGSFEQLGSTEEFIGEWLIGKRDKFVLATKCFMPMGPNVNERGLSRKHIIEAAEHSLRRLKTDYLDLYQAHQFDPDTPIEETLRAFDDLVRQGKVRYIGVSNWKAWQVMKAQGIADKKNYSNIVSVQPRYNLLFRLIEEELVPLCDSEGIGIISYNPLAGGMLTGRYQPGQSVEEHSRFTLGGVYQAGALYQHRYWQEPVFSAVERYRAWCRENAYDMATTAVRWTMHQAAVSSVIIGASRPEQMEVSLAAADMPPLGQEALDWLNELWFSLPRRQDNY
ncbi:MAG: aldo/keto reductase [Syntrophomonadaceae bacterium]|nr:aldo/keto reductase [Syntrophomonadaceae bacterium]